MYKRTVSDFLETFIVYAQKNRLLTFRTTVEFGSQHYLITAWHLFTLTHKQETIMYAAGFNNLIKVKKIRHFWAKFLN